MHICSLYSFIQYSGLYILSFILVFALILFPQKEEGRYPSWHRRVEISSVEFAKVLTLILLPQKKEENSAENSNLWPIYTDGQNCPGK